MKSHQCFDADAKVIGLGRKVVNNSNSAVVRADTDNADKILTFRNLKAMLWMEIEGDASNATCLIASIAIAMYAAPGKTTVSCSL